MKDITHLIRSAWERRNIWTASFEEEICLLIQDSVEGSVSSYDSDSGAGMSPAVEIPGEWIDIPDCERGPKDPVAYMKPLAVVAYVWNRGPLVVLNPQYAFDTLCKELEKKDITVIISDINSGESFYVEPQLLEEIFFDKLYVFDPDDVRLFDVMDYPL